MAAYGNLWRGKRKESVGWIMELTGMWTQGPLVVGCGFFKITLYLPQIQFRFAPVSAFRLIILVDCLITTLLQELNLVGSEVISVELNKIFLLLCVATFGTVPHHNSVHT